MWLSVCLTDNLAEEISVPKYNTPPIFVNADKFEKSYVLCILYFTTYLFNNKSYWQHPQFTTKCLIAFY